MARGRIRLPALDRSNLLHVARIGVDHLLARENWDASTLDWEVSRLVGLERAMGQITFYVTFDVGFLLDLASRCGVSPQDRRVRELVEYPETLRGPCGLWQHSTHPQLAGWLSLGLENSLRRLEDGDWIGNYEPATFTPYRRGAPLLSRAPRAEERDRVQPRRASDQRCGDRIRRTATACRGLCTECSGWWSWTAHL